MDKACFLFKKTRLLPLMFCMVFIFFYCQSEEQTPPDDLGITINDPLPITTYDTTNSTLKSSIIDYLMETASSNPNQIIVGQNVGHADWEGSYLYDSYWESISSLTGKKPAILGMDLGYNDYSGDFTEIAADIEEHWNSGGLISLSMHIPNPKTLADVKDKDFNSSDYTDILKQGNIIRQRWLGMISNIANLFQVLKEKNIIILWRPLHEMNGGWFWWGNDLYVPSQEQLVNLWRDLYDYLSITRQLDNLLWVYSPNFKYNSQQPDTDYFYPGDSYVDIVGLDYYRDQMDEMNTFESYNHLLSIGKPLAVCEIGSDSVRDGTFDNLLYLELLNYYPELSYFLVWHSYPNNKIAIHDNLNASDLMNSTQIITLDEINY